MDKKNTKTHFRLTINERRRVLIFGDLVVGILSLSVGLIVWAINADWLGFSIEFFQERVPGWFYLLPIIWLVLMVEMYDPNKAANWRNTIRNVATSAVLGLFLYSIVYIFSPPNSLPRISIAVYLSVVTVLTLIWRFIYIKIFTASGFLRRVLVVGAGRAGETILSAVESIKPEPFYIIGIIDDDEDKIGEEMHGYKVLGQSDRILELVESEQLTDIIVAISGEMLGTTFQTILDAHEKGVDITRMPVAYEELLGRVPIQLLEADWILRSFVDDARVSRFYDIGKRIIDIIGGALGSIGLLIILPFVSLAILIESGFPVFYRQIRLGKLGVPYEIIKFRTMSQDAEADGQPKWATEDDVRATKVGRFLRKSHIDEVPQFVNVLLGDMSLVGPRSERPELVEYFQRYVPFYRARLLAKPGITGWAQINFPYAATVEETIFKLELDLYYIKHRNMLIDTTVMLRTPATMLGMRGQ